MYPIPTEAATQGLTDKYIGTWFKKTGKRDSIVLASKVRVAGGVASTPVPDWGLRFRSRLF